MDIYDNAIKLEGMRWAGRYLYGMMMAFDEIPHERVTRGEVAATIRDCMTSLNQQIAELEVDRPTQCVQQWDNGPEQDDGPDEDQNQGVDEAHEGFGHELGDDGLESGLPDPVDKTGNQQRND